MTKLIFPFCIENKMLVKLGIFTISFLANLHVCELHRVILQIKERKKEDTGISLLSAGAVTLIAGQMRKSKIAVGISSEGFPVLYWKITYPPPLNQEKLF